MPRADGNVKECVRGRRLGLDCAVSHVWDFYRDRSRADGLSASCKRCVVRSNADYLARLGPHAKAMRDSYRLALTDLQHAHNDEFQALRRILARREPLEDERGFRGRGERWTDGQRYPQPGMKRCRGCSIVKPLDHRHFYRDATRSKDGFAHRCRDCQEKSMSMADRWASQRDARHRARAKGALRDRYPEEFALLRKSRYEDLMTATIEEDPDGLLQRP